MSGSSDRESIIVLDEYQRHGSRRGSNNSVTSNESKAVAAAAAAVTAACNKWLSESSGIFTESTKTTSSTNSVVTAANRGKEYFQFWYRTSVTSIFVSSLNDQTLVLYIISK